MANTANAARAKRADNKFTTARRSATYVLRTAIIIALVVALAFVGFLYAMDLANVYIIVTEGLTMRMECVLAEGDPNELYEYFTPEFLAQDERLINNPYSLYIIESFDYRLDINGISLVPFATSASMTVTERVPYMTGEGTASAPSNAVPEWEPAQYRINCENLDGRWYIADIELLVANPPDVDRPTPDMSLEPITMPPETTLPPTVVPTTGTPEETEPAETDEAD